MTAESMRGSSLLLKDRANTLAQLADEAMMFSSYPAQAPAVEFDRKAFRTAANQARRRRVGARRDQRRDQGRGEVERPEDAALAMPLRQMVTGRAQTPSIDAVLELLGREVVLKRLAHYL